MNQQELKTLLSVDGVSRVCLRGVREHGCGSVLLWALYVTRWGHADDESLDSDVLRDSRGCTKEWRSLGTAFEWLRGMGWNDAVELSGDRRDGSGLGVRRGLAS